jgi:hypothetical protein
MGIWSRRLRMSFIVTFGLALSRAGAQAPLVPQSQPLDPSPITPLAVLMQRPLGPGPRPAFPLANRLGYLCGGDPEWFGCGNPVTQWRFVFGSCRTFFVEPCAPTPPFLYHDARQGFLPPPPPGSVLPPGYGSPGGAASGGCPSCLLGE